MNNLNIDKALNTMTLSQETNWREEDFLRTSLAESLGISIKSTVSRTYYSNQVIDKINKHYPKNDFYITPDLLLKLFYSRLKECSQPTTWRNSEFLDSLYAVISDKKIASRHQFFKNNNSILLVWYGEKFGSALVETDETIEREQKSEQTQLSAKALTDPSVLVATAEEDAYPQEGHNQKQRLKLLARLMLAIFILASIILTTIYLNSCAARVKYRVFFAALGYKDSVWCSSQITFNLKRNNTIDVNYKGMFKDNPELTFKGNAFEGQKAIHVNLIQKDISESGSLIINNGRLTKEWWQLDTLFGIYLGISRNEEPTAYKAILVKEDEKKRASLNDFIRNYIHSPDKHGIASRLFEGGLPR
ncbi:MAG: hypothetical protein HC817_00925 [Saprospiraceae bacterium]|nr:hypothetical protein [Saprospiraceae bacterium]